MYICNDDTQSTPVLVNNLWLKRLDTQLYETSNQNSMKVSKIVKPTNKKRYYEKLRLG